VTRTRLPDARPCITFTMTDPNPMSTLRYDISAGLHEGAIREVFVSCHKTTTAMDIAGRDIGTLISIALQYGASLDELAGAVCRDDKGAPQGIAGAVLDALRAR
jgi:hypothetical protein